MKNTFGDSLAVTIFGESHGAAIGAVLDGLASGIPVRCGVTKGTESMPRRFVTAARNLISRICATRGVSAWRGFRP